jgi:ribonuclease HII
MEIDNWAYEKELYDKGLTNICGVDEVGRGPLNGPVVTACVILPKDFILDGLTDSKKLTEKKREKFYEYIVNNCTCYAIGECSPEEIDKYNILEATKIAMKRAIDQVNAKMKVEHVLIDGNMKFDFEYPYTSIVKGDSKSISIAAASVLAKVTRDRMMIELDKEYPMYGYKKHKGYPTKAHLEAIKKYGLIDGYRKSYGPVSELLKEDK